MRKFPLSLLLFFLSLHIGENNSIVQANQYSYDAAGRLVWATQSNGDSTSYGYDPNGNLESVLSVSAGSDSDGDGLPDWFEIFYSGAINGLDAAYAPFSDGRTYLERFAFALAPDQFEFRPLTSGGELFDPGDGDHYFIFSYLRPALGPETLAYVPQITFDLQTWSSDPENIAEVSVELLADGVERVSIQALIPVGTGPEEEPRAFFRIRVEPLSLP